jgi:1-acyl-sn-glycerol-3-phosphate acyltransferase
MWTGLILPILSDRSIERRGVFYTVLKFLVTRLALTIWRPIVEGRENIPADGRVIIASNHLSFIDSFLIPMVAPRRVAFIAKAEYFETPGIKGLLMKGFFTGIGSVPVRRGDHRAALDSLDDSLAVIESGVAFGIYPEGTRSRDGRLYRGKVGVGWLALKSGATIIPTAVIGTQDLLPVGAKYPRLVRVTVRFGEPMELEDLDLPGGAAAGTARARRAVTDAVIERIQKLSGQEYAGVYNEKPAEE